MDIFMSLEQNLPTVLEAFSSNSPVRGKRPMPTTSDIPEKRQSFGLDELFLDYEYDINKDTYNPFLSEKYIIDLATNGTQQEEKHVQIEEEIPVFLDLQNCSSNESYEPFYWTEDTQQMVPRSPELPVEQTELYYMKPTTVEQLIIETDKAAEKTPKSEPLSQIRTTISPAMFESSTARENTFHFSAISLRGKLVNYEMVPGVRNGCKMLYSLDEDQIYKINKTNADGTVSFTCKESKCAERVTLHPNGNCFYSQSKIGHAHDTKKEYQERINRLVQVKNKCAEIDNFSFGTKVVAVRNIFYSVFEHSAENDALFEKVKRTLLKDMSTALCKSPKTCEKIVTAFDSQNVKEKYGLTIRKTEKGESQPKRTMFYKTVIETDAHSFCLFSSDDIVGAINEKLEPSSRTFLSNATFSIQSFGMFKHLLIIYIDFMGQPIPFIYVLMTTKTEECYSAIFEYINKNIISLEGNSFIADYEKSQRIALRKLFPEISVETSWFHFTQNLKQNALRFREMMKEIRNNSAAKEIYYKLHVIPFLPAELIQSTFQSLKSMARAVHPTKFLKFLKYYERQWLHNETPQSISMMGLSTQLSRGLDDHRRTLGKQMPKKGNFFRFVHALLLQEQNKEKEVRSLSGNGKLNAHRQEKFNENRNEIIKRMRHGLLNAEIEISDFLSHVLKYEIPTKENFMDFENLDDLMDEDDDESDICESHLCKVCEQFEDCLNDLVDKFI